MNNLLKRIEAINAKGKITIDEIANIFRFNDKNNTFDSVLEVKFLDEKGTSICRITFPSIRALEKVISYMENNSGFTMNNLWIMSQ